MAIGFTMSTTLTVIALLVFVSEVKCQSGVNLRQMIQTSSGQIRGSRTFVTNQQIPVDRFLGIPYAEPPTGQGRFRRPVGVRAWSGVKEVTEYKPACFHDFTRTGYSGEDMWIPTVPVSEDCLYLNVWVPRNIQRPMTKMTTLVWIYGGAFVSGSADLPVYDGSYLAATHNVIVVSMNYRLGPFGFLNLGTPDAGGNVGLMDQSLALRLSYENVEAFGGDRRRITLFGESAGAASVSFHLLAQPSWDYFSSAIMQSATALSPWAFARPEESVKRSTAYARHLGCASEDPPTVVECLRGKSARELSSYPASPLSFQPTVDGSFLTKTPAELLRAKDFKRCNVLLGFNTDEQTYFMATSYAEKFGRELAGRPTVTIPEIRRAIDRVTLSPLPILPNATLAFETLLQAYVNSVPEALRGTNVKVVDDVVGDHDFKCSVVELARAYAAEDLGVYLYHFHHRSPTNPWPAWMGVMHGYEIEFVFGMPYNTSAGYSTEDKRMSDVMMSYWTNFATTGFPSSQEFGERVWPNFTVTDERYKLLKSDLLEIKQYPRYAQCSFWKDFLPVLKSSSEATAEAFARCNAGRRDTATVLSVVMLAAFSSLIAPRKG